MTGFDFSKIIVATHGEACGPDGCEPGDDPAEHTSPPVGSDEKMSGSDSEETD